MPVFAQRTIPVTTSKVRIDSDDLENPVLPVCERKYWIVDGDAVREMTAEEKTLHYPAPEKTAEESKGEIEAALAETDASMARVVEDLITVLVDRQIIALSDLPKKAKEKISAREELRALLAEK